MAQTNKSPEHDVQVDKSLYFSPRYCRPPRFASFSYQVKEALATEPTNILEIGPGNGVVTFLLQSAGAHVETVDFDPALRPDHVASVLELPLESDSFDVVICCQVLEHLPWESFN